MRKMLSFMIDNELHGEFEELPAPKVKANEVIEMFNGILEHEKGVTKAIGRAVTRAQEVDDHSTVEFLQWFVMEQREELKLFRSIVDRIKLIGDGPQSLYFIDQEVAAISAKQAAAAATAPAAA